MEDDYLLSLVRLKLKSVDYRVALYLYLRLYFDDYQVINQKKMSDDLEMNISNVNASIKRLIDFNLIEIDEDKHGRHRLYRLVEQEVDPML